MRNMYNIITTFALLLGVLCAGIPAGAQQAPAKKNAPKTYEAFMKKDTRKMDGTFPVYRDAQKCYIEIPAKALGRDLLVSGFVEQGSYAGDVSSVTSLLVFNLGQNNTLETRQIICSDRAEGDMAAAVEASSMQPVNFSYPIAAFGPNKDSYIIDITADVNASGKLFAFPNQTFVNKPAADRSGLDSTYVIRDGVKFISLHSQTDVIPGFLHIPPRDQHTTTLVEWTLQLLPERQVAAREADARVGYGQISFTDYDRNPQGIARVKQIKRWHLAVKPEDADRYRQGELVEPANPIRVYLDQTLSSATERRAVSRAVEEWNRCFEAAGFKNALQVQEGQPEAAFAYHQIVFTYNIKSTTVFVPISDPRTGEILCGLTSIGHPTIEEMALSTAMQIGGIHPEALTDSLCVVREECIRYTASNQLGRMLGLTPNLAGSAAYTTSQLRDAAWVRENGISASVTDGCVVDYAAQAEDGIALRDLFSKASRYDRWAIEWGYRQYPGMDAKAEKEALTALAAQVKDDDDLRFAAKGSVTYHVENDLGQNIVETAALGIKNLERVAPQIYEAFDQTSPEGTWKDYTRYMAAFNTLYDSYIGGAISYIGGISQEPIIAGYNEQAWHYLPKQRAQETMNFLNRYLFQGAPAWRTDEQEVDVIGINKDSKTNAAIMQTCRALMSVNNLSHLLMAEEKIGTEAYTLNDMFGALDRHVFMNYSASKPLTRYQVLVQYNLVREFLSTYNKINAKKGNDALSYYMVNKGEEMKKQLDRLGKTHSDPASRRYYRGLSVFMTRGLKAGMSSLFSTK